MSSDFPGPLAFFSHDHRRCDELWAALESQPDLAAWQAFDRAMRQHFAMEEEVLFPAIEEATGMQGGPTHVMRMEHVQMKAVLDQMAAAAARADFDNLVDQGDTLLMLIQQHNVKEEGIVYPLADRALGHQWPQIAERLQAY